MHSPQSSDEYLCLKRVGNEPPNHTRCFTSDTLLPRIARQSGFHLVNEGTLVLPKRGYIATEVGSYLHLNVSTMRSGDGSMISVFISYLASYRRMGVANIRFVLFEYHLLFAIRYRGSVFHGQLWTCLFQTPQPMSFAWYISLLITMLMRFQNHIWKIMVIVSEGSKKLFIGRGNVLNEAGMNESLPCTRFFVQNFNERGTWNPLCTCIWLHVS